MFKQQWDTSNIIMNSFEFYLFFKKISRCLLHGDEDE